LGILPIAMTDQTEEYRPPPPPTGDHRLTQPALIVAFQQLAGFTPYALSRPDVIGRRVLQDAARDALGRDLEDPSVSREHARLERSQGGAGILSLECLSSRGMTVNGWPMKQGERATLFGGEILRMGGTLLTYVRQLAVARREDFRADADITTKAGPIVGPFGLRGVRFELERLGTTHARVVLVHGETGTGKERLAHAVAEKLRAQELIPLNIAMLPKDQVVAELFGVVDGAYTGARARTGAVRDAANKRGALFLDEIGDLPLDAQVALLRFLQDGEIQVLGAKHDGAASRKYDVPVMLATHRNLEDMVASKEFRADLAARIHQRIEVPPLRERSHDALPILLQIWANRRPVEMDRIPTDAIEALLLAWHEENVRGLDRLAIEAEKRSAKRLTLDAPMVKATLRNRGEGWWRAALCPSAAAEALRSAHTKKKSGSASQVAAVDWLNVRAVGQPISEGSFKRFLERT
jgi:MoxR-like ATPase